MAECLAMSGIIGYQIGGTIHLIINNQIGFTTSPQHSRSSQYCSDVGKMVQAPIFHVNGDDPEACVRVAELAFEYRQTFHKDVIIDMVCYRRYGHNEGDDPSYTQPLMYQAIGERRSVRKLYVESLVKRGELTLDEAEQALADFQGKLQSSLDAARAERSGAGEGGQAARRRRRAGRTWTPGSPAQSWTGSSSTSPPTPTGSPRIPSWPASSRSARRCTPTARSTGPPPRRCRSARW
ncbi:MAG: thiamine pyrophosphate-dependent enzyme [Ilumatobacteraceae bacterium]